MRLFHPVSGEPVEVPDFRPQLAAYYRGEGYLEQPPAAENDPHVEAGAATPSVDSGAPSGAGPSLDL